MVFGSATLDEAVASMKKNDLPSAEMQAENLARPGRDFISALVLSYVKFRLGKFDDAIGWSLKALRLAKSQADSELAALLLAGAYIRKNIPRDARYASNSFMRKDSFWKSYLDMILLLNGNRGKEAAAEIGRMLGKDRKLAFGILEDLVANME